MYKDRELAATKKKEALRLAHKRYDASPKGRENKRRHVQSPKGRAEAQRRRQSPKYIEAVRRYQQTPKGRAATWRNNHSANRAANLARSYEVHREARLAYSTAYNDAHRERRNFLQQERRAHAKENR